MAKYWAPLSPKAMHWVNRLDKAILRLRPPRQACFISIVNAIAVQVDDGAHPETVRNLLRVLLTYAAAEGISPGDLGLPGDDVDAIIDSMAP